MASVFGHFYVLKPILGHFWVICNLNQVLTSVFGYFSVLKPVLVFFRGFVAYIRPWILFLIIFHGETSFGSFLGDLQPISGIGLCLGLLYMVKLVFGHSLVICILIQVLASVFGYYSVLKPVLGHFWGICYLHQEFDSAFGRFHGEIDFRSFLGDLQPKSGIGFRFGLFYVLKPMFDHFWVICSRNQVLVYVLVSFLC